MDQSWDRYSRSVRAGRPENTRERQGPRRMGGEDSAFLELERPGQPMTNMYLVVLGDGADRPTGERPAPMTIESLRTRLIERLDVLPALRWRFVQIPLRLHHPVLVDDPAFNLDDHISRFELPAPGGGQELDALCGTLCAAPLDRSRPLWHLTLVDGLADNRQAVIWRFHHGLLDGAASLTTLARFFGSEHELSDVVPELFAPGAFPGRGRLLAAALRDHARSLPRLPGLVRTTSRGMRAQEEYEASAPVHVPHSPRDVPVCALNAFGPRRQFCRTTLPLSDFKLVRQVAGVTFSDVVLAVVGGALRGVLVSDGTLPERPLVAGVPVSLEPPGSAERHSGNKFGSLTTSLATDVDDAWERLLTISAVAGVARRGFALVGTEIWGDWLDVIPPFVVGPLLRYHHWHRRTHRRVADLNVTISNVHGPATPWRLGSRPAEEVYLNGPPNNGVGVVVTFLSYGERVQIGTVSVEDCLGDVALFTAGLATSLAELVEAALLRQQPPARL